MKLANAVDTIIVLMGASNAKEYSQKLISVGIDHNAAITAVCNTSRKDQKIVHTTLGEVAGGEAEDFGDLCTIIINIRRKTTEVDQIVEMNDNTLNASNYARITHR